MVYCNKLFRTVLLLAVMMSVVPVAHGVKADGQGDLVADPADADGQADIFLVGGARIPFDGGSVFPADQIIGGVWVDHFPVDGGADLGADPHASDVEPHRKGDHRRATGGRNPAVNLHRFSHDRQAVGGATPGASAVDPKRTKSRRTAPGGQGNGSPVDPLQGQGCFDQHQQLQQPQEGWVRLYRDYQSLVATSLQQATNYDTLNNDYRKLTAENSVLTTGMADLKKENSELKKSAQRNMIIALPFKVFSIYKFASYLWNKFNLGNHPKVIEAKNMLARVKQDSRVQNAQAQFVGGNKRFLG